MTEQFKPCPFCGSSVLLTTVYEAFREDCPPGMFQCTNPDCGAAVIFPMTVNWTKEKEMDLWNRRVDQ